METKRCSKCGEVKAVDAFGKRRDQACGYARACTCCERARHSAYRKANLEKCRAVNASWRKANQERKKATDSAWRKANLEKGRIKQLKWKKNNPEKAAQIVINNRRMNQYKLGNSYVKKCINLSSGLPVSLIPPELIEAKRAHLQMVRILKKEQQKCQTK